MSTHISRNTPHPSRQFAQRAVLPLLVALAAAAPCSSKASGPPQGVPEFTGITTWLNGPPRSMAALRGKVVLIDFWAYSCINCLRAIPHVEHLYETYKDRGLVVIGVHAPEYDFEKDPANVRRAVHHLAITYPVALDNQHATWNAWHNQYWPAEYLVDQRGRLIGHHYGEGDYRRMENAVRLLLGLNPLSRAVSPDGFMPSRGDTPELHLGIEAGQGLATEQTGHDGVRHFRAPAVLPMDHYAFSGMWEIRPEYARVAGSDSKLRLHCKAAKIFMVAGAEQPVTVEISVDGKQRPAITVHHSDQYTLYVSDDDREHVVTLHFTDPGARVYSFTFG